MSTWILCLSLWELREHTPALDKVATICGYIYNLPCNYPVIFHALPVIWAKNTISSVIWAKNAIFLLEGGGSTAQFLHIKAQFIDTKTATHSKGLLWYRSIKLPLTEINAFGTRCPTSRQIGRLTIHILFLDYLDNLFSSSISTFFTTRSGREYQWHLSTLTCKKNWRWERYILRPFIDVKRVIFAFFSSRLNNLYIRGVKNTIQRVKSRPLFNKIVTVSSRGVALGGGGLGRRAVMQVVTCCPDERDKRCSRV